ncbi:MAG: hypothetical protein HZC38_10150 [Chloroflexi bacterium]|nr:hypothetical protein [Chloroflexota bacterium]MBI5713767.1 hypothetical protein [Chloroflexota bacterium]
MITHIAKQSETPEDLKRILDEAQKAGVDVEGLKHNLSLTPDQRLDQFLKALAWLEWAQQGKS